MSYPDLRLFLLVPQESESLMEYYQTSPLPPIVSVSSSGMWKFDGVLSVPLWKSVTHWLPKPEAKHNITYDVFNGRIKPKSIHMSSGMWWCVEW